VCVSLLASCVLCVLTSTQVSPRAEQVFPRPFSGAVPPESKSTTLHHYTTTPLHHYTTPLHYITSHHTTSHYITSHYTTLHYTTLHYYVTSHHTTSHHITSHHITLHHTTSHYITLHHITLHHTTSHHTSTQCECECECECDERDVTIYTLNFIHSFFPCFESFRDSENTRCASLTLRRNMSPFTWRMAARESPRLLSEHRVLGNAEVPRMQGPKKVEEEAKVQHQSVHVHGDNLLNLANQWNTQKILVRFMYTAL
jgi:hypothetical protein